MVIAIQRFSNFSLYYPFTEHPMNKTNNIKVSKKKVLRFQITDCFCTGIRETMLNYYSHNFDEFLYTSVFLVKKNQINLIQKVSHL